MVSRRNDALLRDATPADAEALARFEQRAFTGYYAAHRFSENQFRYYLARETTIAHLARARGQIIGYALGAEGRGRRRHLARLLSIAVDPAHRKRRVGRRLLSAFLESARRRGSRLATLEVAAPNQSAIRLFASHGFVPDRKLRRYYSRSVDGLRMRRVLDETDRHVRAL
jgi:[ribosomal protein S18]-alanine N-acetyltransferase